MKLRNALRQLRTELHMSQTDLAAALHISFATVNRWETGHNTPNRSAAVALLELADHRGVSTICKTALSEVLFPSSQPISINDLKYAEMDCINQMLNDSSNGVSVCDAETYELLYVNRQGATFARKSLEEAEGNKCYAYFFHRTAPCEGCRINCHGDKEHFQFSTYLSPDTGRYYLLRGKMISWMGRQAHIEYITDATDMYHAQQRLEQSRRTLKEACRFAEMWVFTYDIQTDVCHLDERFQQQFLLPEVIEHFPDGVFQYDLILPEYHAVFRNMTQKIKDGCPEADADIRVFYHDGKPHWMRCRMDIITYEPGGKPKTAVCSAQPVDNEKVLEARMRLEREKLQGGEDGLLGCIMSDLSRNIITEQHRFNERLPAYAPGLPFSTAVADSATHAAGEEESERFLRAHNRERLLSAFEQGITGESIEYCRRGANGEKMWRKNVLNLLTDPASGNVLLCEYCYDVSRQHLHDDMVNAALSSVFDFYGMVNFKEDKVTVIVNAPVGGDTMVNTVYTQAVLAYAQKHVPPAEQQAYLDMVSPERVIRQLQDANFFEFTHREMVEDGHFAMKRTRFTRFGSDGDTYLITRTRLSVQ